MRRIPVIRQNSQTECAAACLAMILNYHGYRVSLRTLGDRLAIGRDGLSALALARAAREHGLAVRAFALDTADLSEVQLPAVVFWENNHFLVVERWSQNWVEVVDPGSGRRRMTAAEFEAGFSGVVLMMWPSGGFRPMRIADPERRGLLLGVLARHRTLAAQILLASLLLQVVGLVAPALSAVVVDQVLPTGNGDLLMLLGYGLLIMVVAQAALGFLRSLVILTLRGRVDRELSTGLISHLIRLPYRYFSIRGTADLVQRSTSTTALRDMLTGQILSALLDGPLALGYLVLITLQDPVFGGCVLAAAALQCGLLIATRRRIGDLTQRELRAEAATQGRLMEAIGGIETIKASGAEELAIARWSQSFTVQLRTELRSGLIQGALETALGLVRFLAPMALLWAGSWRVLDATLTLGELLALNALGTLTLIPLASMIGHLQQLQTAGTHVDRLTDILASPTEPDSGIEVKGLRGAVELSGVGFRYDPRAPWVLRDVSVSIAPGQKVAVVGRSGSGKSTLARVLLALHPATEGEIRYDGVPAGELNLRSLRRRFGVVAQDTVLFTGTIRDNIALLDPGMPQERVMEAARLACVHDEIAAMPMGYETMLTDGNGMSGGQRQRLALARALAALPRILLLDEATSHLDTLTEAAIEDNLSWLTMTRIVIAHRLSTVRDADLILVVDGGRIAERGTHRELLARGGLYTQLVSRDGIEAGKV